MIRTLIGLNLFLFLCLTADCRKQSANTKLPATASRQETTENAPPLMDTSQHPAVTEYKSLLGEVFYGKKDGVDLTGLPEKLLYPNATPISRYGEYIPRFGCSYNLETKDSPAKVLAYYQQVLSQWKLVAETNEENYQSRSYVSAGKREVVEINVSRKNSKTLIFLCHTYRIME